MNLFKKLFGIKKQENPKLLSLRESYQERVDESSGLLELHVVAKFEKRIEILSKELNMTKEEIWNHINYFK